MFKLDKMIEKMGITIIHYFSSEHFSKRATGSDAKFIEIIISDRDFVGFSTVRVKKIF